MDCGEFGAIGCEIQERLARLEPPDFVPDVLHGVVIGIENGKVFIDAPKQENDASPLILTGLAVDDPYPRRFCFGQLLDDHLESGSLQSAFGANLSKPVYV